MSALASAAAMMTLVYQPAEAVITAASAEESSLSADIRVFTKWEIDPIRSVLDLQRLAPNWDGYGTTSLDGRTAALAVHLIRQLGQVGFDDSLPIPHVGPISGGGVALQMWSGPRELNLSIFPEGTIEYVKSEGSEPFEEGPVSPWKPSQLGALATWLLAP